MKKTRIKNVSLAGADLGLVDERNASVSTLLQPTQLLGLPLARYRRLGGQYFDSNRDTVHI
jgi:hypothetical protein